MFDHALHVVALLDALKPESILNWLGPWAVIGVCLILFAECGLLIGFFLPGDSLLFIAGLFIGAGTIKTPLWLAMLVFSVSAVLGNLAGYWIGASVGPKLFDKPDSKLFKKEYVDKTHEFFEKYGPRAILLARLVPIVRTFITAVAGIARMDYRVFAIYSAIGGVIWASAFTLLGYLLGNIPFVKNNVELMAILIVLISVIPMIWEYMKHRREKAADAEADPA